MELIALIISITSLVIAFIALYLTILKKGYAEIIPYLEDFELTAGMRHNNISITLGGTMHFMIKNTGASSVFINGISWQGDVTDIQNINLQVSLNSPEKYMNGLTLKPYEQIPGSVNIRYSLGYQDQNINENVQLFKNEISRGKMSIKLKYIAYENENVRKTEKRFDVTGKMKHFVFLNEA